MRLLLAVANGIDAVSRRIGQAAKWLAVALVLMQFAVVVMRYAFSSSFAWAQEAVIYFHAPLFMLAIGYVYMLDAHVRVDFFWGRWRERPRAWLELAGVAFFVLPFCALVVWASWGYVALSFRFNEGPMQMGGVPLLPYLKALILVMVGLLALQSVSVACRAIAVIGGAASETFPHRQAIGEA
ncbi:TRAP transporter small permease subunit [Roseococcus sp. SYP-B2431]|uniref:TRAP transporter small permease subunit n=1 Tax=Roseococcus sp. SYP-B2431 TaxID=2496640 RepID=UPI0010400F9D|nr:TRAP transporter small permease subunit [Roseococcus sp. SYP-B2431]TCH97148.1 TRAP transporter small permease subunit [Roseococcus sp. SYP-B2431]